MFHLFDLLPFLQQRMLKVIAATPPLVSVSCVPQRGGGGLGIGKGWMQAGSKMGHGSKMGQKGCPVQFFGLVIFFLRNCS